MTGLLFAVVAHVVCQVALFGLALLAYVHWSVPVRDLAVLLRECRPSSHGTVALGLLSGRRLRRPESFPGFRPG
jgi:hypothetical protein